MLKKIALITDGIWPYVMGGMQKHSYYLCKYFAANKIHVHLFHFNQSNLDINKLDVFTEEEKQYIQATVVDFPNVARGFGHYLVNSYRYSIEVYEKIKNHLNEYDFIYTKGFTGWHFVRYKNKSDVAFPAVGVNFHGYEMFQVAPDFKSKIQQVLLLKKPVKEITKKADVVFSYGANITSIVKKIGVSQDKIIEIPSGVEQQELVSEIRKTEKTIRFIYLGRYERRKGIEELSKAITDLSENLNYEFHFIGPVPDEKKINNPKIIYHGEVRDKQQLNKLLQSGDVLVSASSSEGMPNVILEAMAKGLAVLATDVGAVSLLVNDETGWLMLNRKPSEIKKHLQKIIETDAKKIDTKKEAALSLIKSNYTWEIIIGRLISELSSFLARYKAFKN